MLRLNETTREQRSVKIYVDADACPVKHEVMRVATRHAIAVVMVANSWMRLPDSALLERVVVDDGADAADDWIVAHAGVGDVVITADIALASRSLKAGAKVVGPTGKPFTDAGIGMALAMRDLMADLRESGDVRGTNPSFTARDRSQFLQTLEQAVQDINRGK